MFCLFCQEERAVFDAYREFVPRMWKKDRNMSALYIEKPLTNASW